MFSGEVNASGGGLEIGAGGGATTANIELLGSGVGWIKGNLAIGGVSTFTAGIYTSSQQTLLADPPPTR